MILHLLILVYIKLFIQESKKLYNKFVGYLLIKSYAAQAFSYSCQIRFNYVPINILSFRTVPDLYSQKLEDEGVVTKKDIEEIVSEHYAWLNEHLNSAESYVPEVSF